MMVQKLFGALCIFIFTLFICESQGYNLTVLTKNGYVEGYEQVSGSNRSISYHAFKGIPYAEPPIGSLRFQEPVPVSSWTKVLQAKDFAQKCAAPSNDGSPTITGSEDCLYLNIYVPDIGVDTNDNAILSIPVMVFIHGGAFVWGDSYPDGSFLLQHQVIVVTIAYRLGIFGFLSVENEYAWGNAGLKDQTLALKWIKENIENFGGDPDRITIFGQSAGGASIEYHLVSPKSAGLYTQAIVESGSTLNEWGFQRSPTSLTLEFAKLFGIDSDDLGKVVQALQNVSYEYLLTKSWDLAIKFLPIVEPEHPGAFINRSSYEIWSEGAYNKVPVIIGYNTEDGSYGKDSCSMFSLYHETIIPTGLKEDLSPTEIQEVIEKIAGRYFPDNSYDDFTRCINFCTQQNFVKGIRKTIAFLATSPAPVYFYRFLYASPENYTYGVNGGAGHGEELLFLWMDWFHPLANEIDIYMRDRVCTLWTNFAKYGNPTPSRDTNLDWALWPQIQDAKDEKVGYLDIDIEFDVGTDPNFDDYLFWKELYQNYSKSTIYTY